MAAAVGSECIRPIFTIQLELAGKIPAGYFWHFLDYLACSTIYRMQLTFWSSFLIEINNNFASNFEGLSESLVSDNTSLICPKFDFYFTFIGVSIVYEIVCPN